MKLTLKNRLAFSFLTVLSLFSVSCAGTTRTYYDMNLSEVKRSDQAVVNFDSSKNIRLQATNSSDAFVFEDKDVKIEWFPSFRNFAFRLTNKTTFPMQIIWDEGQFVDTQGLTYQLIHADMDERQSRQTSTAQLPTDIVPAGFVEKKVFPSRVEEDDKAGSLFAAGRVSPDIFPSDLSRYNLDTLKTNLKDKNVKIKLPVLLGASVKNYLFTFRIGDIGVLEN